MKKQRTLLLTAYAVNPYKGSEDGTGWNISKTLAKENKVHIITRKNNAPEIQRYLNEVNDPVHDQMIFHYYDLPKWILNIKYKLGERGYVFYYYLWQAFLPLFVKKQKIKFDLAHAVNFHSDSHPQFLWTLGKPVFWGPIGHHPPVPKEFLKPVYGIKNWIKDRLYNTVKFCMRNLDPFYYISKWTAKRIFVINSGVNNSVRANSKKVIVLPAVAHDAKEENTHELKVNDEFIVLAVGRFVYMKGFDITIRSFARFYKRLPPNKQKKTKLKLVGKGEALEKLKQIIVEENISLAVEILKWVPKSEMESIYNNAAIFCFGSHEGAGMVIPEALSYGLPVICFKNYGPGELCDDKCAIKIPYSTYEMAVDGFSKGLLQLFDNPERYAKYSAAARQFSKNRFSWDHKATVIANAYAQVG